MKELDTAKLLSAAVKLSETRSTELLHKLRIELLSKLDNIQLVEGPSGSQGIKGLKGDTGDRGFIGATGARGERGFQGEQGIQGEQGERGIQGEQGLKGDTGDKGEQGLKGDKGNRGEQGLKGDPGDKGEKGDRGFIGPQGKQGLRGDKGERGDIGPTGLTGSTGPQGIQGEIGAQGPQGDRGKDGMPGAIGPAGKTGDTGPEGPKGARGAKGTKGDDADIKPLQKKFDDLAKSVENKISRIAYTVTAAGASAGSGEVNLYALDDVDYTSVKTPTDGQSLIYDSVTNKWKSGSGSIVIQEDGVTVGTVVKSLNFIGSTITASGNSTIISVNLNPDAYYIGNTIARTLINDRLQVANAAALYATKINPTTSGIHTHTGHTTISTNLSVAGNTVLGTNSNRTIVNGRLSANGRVEIATNLAVSGNTSIAGNLTGVDYIDIDTLATTTGAVGRLRWNDTDGTLDLGMKGGLVTQQIGQESFVRIRNNTGSTLLDGKVVKLTGTVGFRTTGAYSQATDSDYYNTIGVLTEDIANNDEGFVTTFGLVRNLNTHALAEGNTIYLSASVAGGLTDIKPALGQRTVVIGMCTRSHPTQGALFVTVHDATDIDTVPWAAFLSTNTAIRTLVSDRLQIANAAAIYQTKAVERAALANTNAYIASIAGGSGASWAALISTNTAIRTLVSDRLQIANAAAIYQTKVVERAALANTNASIAAQASRITLVNTNLTGTNTAIRTLVSDRIQVANAASLYATKINPTTSGVYAHTGRATISTNLTVSGNTSSNKLTATSSLTSTGNTTLGAGLSANGSFGTPNYVLKTNGAGIFWAAVASGGSDASKLAVANSFVKLTSYSSNTRGITQLANNVVSTTALATNPAGHIALILPNNTTIKIPYWL